MGPIEVGGGQPEAGEDFGGDHAGEDVAGEIAAGHEVRDENQGAGVAEIAFQQGRMMA